MSSVEERTIELSKKKILLLILGSCVFVGLGIWLLSLDEATIRSQHPYRSPSLIHGVGIVSIVFFGATGAFTIHKLFDKKPGLVLNSSGVIDNSSSVSAGLIQWSEILGAEIYEIHGQKMLIIKVRNPQEYIERGGALKRALNNASHKMCGSPIAITSNALNVDFSELLSLFEEYKRRYGNA